MVRKMTTLSVSELILFQGGFAMSLANALEESGVLKKSVLADHFDEWGKSSPPNPAKDLLSMIAASLRVDSPPPLYLVDGDELE